MGTLPLLLICALLGGACSLMFAKYQNQAIDYSMPFEVMVHSPEPEDDFSEEISVVRSYSEIQDQRIYQIYEDGSQTMNRYFGTHVTTTLEKHVDKEGNFIPGREYYTYDTYMKLRDYNALRKMLGKEAITLDNDEYALQTKIRVARDFGDDIYGLSIQAGDRTLSLAEVCTEAFSQNGINGADYLIIVPDGVCEEMPAYYSVYVADIEGEGTAELRDALSEVHSHKHGLMTYDEYEEAQEAKEAEEAKRDRSCCIPSVGTLLSCACHCGGGDQLRNSHLCGKSVCPLHRCFREWGVLFWNITAVVCGYLYLIFYCHIYRV